MELSLAHDVIGASSRRHFRRVRRSMRGLVRGKRLFWADGRRSGIYTHPHVLVIDEVGYLRYGPDAANVLFHVVNDRHLRKRPMIFTTNKPLNDWGKVLHDEDMAAAILDRV